jgi:serine/threonine protein phosphatase PrpC
MAINEANSRLVSMADQYDTALVPGSTVAALLIKDSEAAVVWAGDSRIYRIRNGHAEQITRDHSHVQELVDQQLISPEEAESHPMANVITRAVGIEEQLELDVLNFGVADGDHFVVCSDGLSKLVSLEEILSLTQAAELEEGVQSLLHTALVRGAPDNVTIISVQCKGTDSA